MSGIVLSVGKKTTRILNVDNSLYNFFAKISLNNPGLSEWMTLGSDEIIFPTSRTGEVEAI